jgi:hypothetical protein
MQNNFYPLMIPVEFSNYCTNGDQNYSPNFSNYEIFKDLKI